jgi:hypothetical protein
MVPGVPKAVPAEGNVAVEGDALRRAARLRAEAQALDPNHEAPAWQDEAATHDHDALLKFYADLLSR